MLPNTVAGLRPTTTELPSGLRIVGVPMPWVHSVVVDVDLRIGSRYEKAQDNGISHFLEHVLFRGTATRPSAHELALAFEERGGWLSAATSVDHGSLVLAAPVQTFAELLPLFGEVYRQPLLDQLEVEKGIVREEILESLDDAGRQIDADHLLRASLFGTHSLGFPITGTVRQLDSFDSTRLRAHHARHYTSSNTVISVATPGDVDHAIRMLETAFAGLAPGAPLRVDSPAEMARAEWKFVRHAASQTSLRLGFRAPGENDVLEPATDLLVRIIDDGMSTRLYHRICDTRGLCYDVAASYEQYADAGLLDMSAETAHENAVQVFEEMLAIAQDLRNQGPTAAELDRAKARYGWQLLEMLDEPGDVAEFFAIEHLTGSCRSPQDRLEQLEAVTREQVQAAAGAVFRSGAASAVAVGLLGSGVRDRMERMLRAF